MNYLTTKKTSTYIVEVGVEGKQVETNTFTLTTWIFKCHFMFFSANIDMMRRIGIVLNNVYLNQITEVYIQIPEYSQRCFFNSLYNCFVLNYYKLHASTSSNKVRPLLLQLLTSGKRLRELFTPFQPHFYIVKLGYTGGYQFYAYIYHFITFAPKHRLWVPISSLNRSDPDCIGRVNKMRLSHLKSIISIPLMPRSH